jgi:hypothetical protein
MNPLTLIRAWLERRQERKRERLRQEVRRTAEINRRAAALLARSLTYDIPVYTTIEQAIDAVRSEMESELRRRTEAAENRQAVADFIAAHKEKTK